MVRLHTRLVCVLVLLDPPSITNLCTRRSGVVDLPLVYCCDLPCLNLIYTPTYYSPPPAEDRYCLTHFTGAAPLLTSCHTCYLYVTVVRCSGLSLLCTCGLGLCPFSELVCDLLPRQWYQGFAKGTLPEEYLSHHFDQHCLEDTRLIWCFS